MLCLRVLQACKKGNWTEALSIKSRHCVPGKVEKGIPSIKGLAGLIHDAKNRVLKEQLAESVADDPALVGKRQDNTWHCRMYAMWRRQRLLPHPTLVQEGFAPSSANREVEMLREHWSPVFSPEPVSVNELVDVVGAHRMEDILAFVPALPWETLRVEEPAIESMLLQARSTAAGPDEITYSMLRPLAPAVASIACDWFRESCSTAVLPHMLAEMAMVFLPKKSG
eukprot:4974790-Amphidinium_carterae.1